MRNYKINKELQALLQQLEQNELSNLARIYYEFGEHLPTWFLDKSKSRNGSLQQTSREAIKETANVFYLLGKCKKIARYLTELAEEKRDN